MSMSLKVLFVDTAPQSGSGTDTPQASARNQLVAQLTDSLSHRLSRFNREAGAAWDVPPNILVKPRRSFRSRSTSCEIACVTSCCRAASSGFHDAPSGATATAALTVEASGAT